MGGGSKTTETVPWRPAQPFILSGLQAVDTTFRQNQPALQAAATDFYSAFNRSAPGAEVGINQAQDFTNATLRGDFMGQNPGRAAYEAAMQGRPTNDYVAAIGRNPATRGLLDMARGGFVGQGEAGNVFRQQAASPTGVNNFAGAVSQNPALQRLGLLSDGSFVGQGQAADFFSDATGGRMLGENPFAGGGFVGGGDGADYFRRAAGGEFVNSNPFLQDNIDAATGDAANRVNSLFASAGRFGGSAHQGTLARETGRISSAMRMEDLQQERNRQQQAAGQLDSLTRADRGLQLSALDAERGRQMQAAGQLDGLGRADRNLQLSALGQMGNFAGQDVDRRLAALGQDQAARFGAADQQFRAASALDGMMGRDRALQLQAMGQLDSSFGRDAGLRLQALGQDEQARAGAEADRLRAAGLLDQGFNLDMARRDAAVGTAMDLRAGNLGLLGNAAQLPWLGVQAQSGGVTQLSSPYSTTTERRSGGLGNALLGLGGSVLSAAGAAGGFGPLFSEPGLKKNVRQIGTRPDGLGVYEYEYKDGTGLPKGRQVGVMADEVQAVRPDALGPTIGGARTVDYSRLSGDGMNGLPAGEKPRVVPDKALRPSFGQRLGGLLENAVNPDPERKGAGLSLLGAALMASAEDTPFANVGQALLAARGGLAERQDMQRRLDNDQTQADALAALRQSQMTNSMAPEAMPASVREYQFLAGLPPEEQARYMAMKRGSEQVIAVLGPDGNPIFVPRSEAPGMRAPVKPTAAAGGGARLGMSGGVPVVTSPDQLAALPSGAVFKAPDGTIRRKP